MKELTIGYRPGDRVEIRGNKIIEFYEMYCIMFLTGLRIGEVGALTWSDVDFKSKCININKALSTEYKDGVKTLVVTTPKTINSYRKIPFIGDVEKYLEAQKIKQLKRKKELGSRWRAEEKFGDLVFTSSMGSPVIRHIAESQIRKVVEQINQLRMVQANKEDTEYIPFGKMYPHAIRHTFCSRCFERGLEPKVVQAIMGHANYSTTIEIYTHVTEDKRKMDVSKFGNLYDNTFVQSEPYEKQK